jgi:hypothetical protein
VYRNLAADEQKRHSLATNHLNIYVTARLYWDVNQDVDAMLEDYYDKFYGPAAKEMKAFVEYSEANWMKANKEMPVIDRMSELLAAAQKAAGDTVFGRRVALVAQYAEPLKQLRERLAAGRQPPREARALLRNTADFKLDGKLDESFWEGLPVYRLGDLATGKAPPCGTTFRLAWADDALCLGIQCQDPDTKTLNIAGRQNEDTNVWNGDCVEILLETQTHSYYQIAISPSGALIDADRRKGINILWSSGAKVAASIGEGSWSLEVRIPAAGDNAEEEDPLNGVSGRRPSKTYPWYINVCRQRMRDGVRELSAFCATGGTHFHDRTKFAELIVR